MSHNEVQVRALMCDRMREARAARAATAIIRTRRAQRRAGGLQRATRRRIW